MKKKYFYKYCGLSIFLLILFSLSCSNEPEVIEKKQELSAFGLYLLEDQSKTWENIKDDNLENYKLKEWITSDMIDFYDYSSHVIYLKKDYNELLSFPHVGNTPFVVVANKKPCYAGRFNTPADTTLPHVVLTPLPLCNDMIMLEFNPPHRRDIRLNENVKAALVELDKFKPGITLTFSVIVKDKNVNPPLLRPYIHCNTYEDDNIYIKSNDRDLIKTAGKTYQTKVVFYNSYWLPEEKYYYFFYPEKHPNDSINPRIIETELGYDKKYFTALNRFSTEYAYSKIISSYFTLPKKFGNSAHTNTYNCYVEYYGGVMGGDKNMRLTPKGRMYVGYVRSKTIRVIYNETDGYFSTIDAEIALPY